MKFSIKVQYGLQALLDLALKYGGGPVQIKDIAKNQKVPIRFLEQLLLLLKRGGFVVSTRGKEGGYNLAKHPSDIPLLDLIERLDGPIELTSKKLKKVSVIYDIFFNLEESLKADLAKLTLEDLVYKKRQKERAFMYNI